MRSSRRRDPSGSQNRHRNPPSPNGTTAAARLVREDVLLRPAFEIKQDAMRQEFKTGAAQPLASLTGQHRIESSAQRMQVEHVRSGISKLLFIQPRCPPIRT